MIIFEGFGGEEDVIEEKIYIPDTKAAIELVKFFQFSSYDVDLAVGQDVVDAKSIVGVLAMGVGKEAKLRVYSSKQQQELNLFLRQYRAAYGECAMRAGR